MSEASGKRSIARHAATGAILGTLCAVAAHVLGVQQLLRTPGLVLYLPAALVGAILGSSRLRPLLWIAAAVIALICITVAYTPIVSTLAGRVVRRDQIPTRVDAIAVLSAGLTPDGMMRSETLDRLLTGLGLAKHGVGRALLISRERRSFGQKFVSDSADQQSLLSLIQPSAQVIFVDSVLTTRDEAQRMKAIARTHGWLKIAVVTSPMHS
ncbi:MAG TPA: YdcF family protein, partial [Gemmatimonadaceae bacterium]|nr:YdcF family protein [Gemmatimonadaceae bacterium]